MTCTIKQLASLDTLLAWPGVLHMVVVVVSIKCWLDNHRYEGGYPKR